MQTFSNFQMVFPVGLFIFLNKVLPQIYFLEFLTFNSECLERLSALKLNIHCSNFTLTQAEKNCQIYWRNSSAFHYHTDFVLFVVFILSEIYHAVMHT